MTIRIVTDSTCDLPVEITRTHGITVVPLYINIGEKSYLDGVDMTRQEFYAGLPGFDPFPRTAVPGPGKFTEVYDRLASEGATEIVSIHISPTLSAVVNAARLGAEAAEAARVTVIDSGQLSMGIGFIVERAAQAAAEGRSLPDIVALVNDLRKRAYVFAALQTTEFLRRSGRVSGFQHSLGTLLQIKPVLRMHDGKAESEKIRSSKIASKRLIELLQALQPIERLALVHTGDPEGAQALWRQVAPHFPDLPEPIAVSVTPVIGAHIGPGAVGFACLAGAR